MERNSARQIGLNAVANHQEGQATQAIMIETASATPVSPVSVTITARELSLVQDKPHEFGGQNAGMMASELLLGALLACQHSTFVKVAAKRKSVTQLVRLDGTMHFEGEDISKISIQFLVSGQTEQMETLLRLTDKICTISRALKVPVESTFETSRQ